MTAKRDARFEMLRKSSRERIENAALELFAHNGYGHTSISQIAKSAGISKGLMYNYYESKEALLQAIVQKGFDFGDSLLDSSQQFDAGNPVELLRFIIDAAITEVQHNQKYWKLLTSLAFQEDVLKTMDEEIEQKKKEHINMGKTIFEHLGYPQPELQAMFFGATLDGIFMHYILSPEEYPIEEIRKLLVDQFCKRYGE